jgi:hypothetical protein
MQCNLGCTHPLLLTFEKRIAGQPSCKMHLTSGKSVTISSPSSNSMTVIIFWTTLVRSFFPRHSFYFDLTILSDISLDDSVNLFINERSPSSSPEAHTDFTSTSLWTLFFTCYCYKILTSSMFHRNLSLQ